jgi:hypothetical protein
MIGLDGANERDTAFASRPALGPEPLSRGPTHPPGVSGLRHSAFALEPRQCHPVLDPAEETVEDLCEY